MCCSVADQSALKVPVLSFGAGTFGGSGPLFKRVSGFSQRNCPIGSAAQTYAEFAFERTQRMRKRREREVQSRGGSRLPPR